MATNKSKYGAMAFENGDLVFVPADESKLKNQKSFGNNALLNATHNRTIAAIQTGDPQDLFFASKSDAEIIKGINDLKREIKELTSNAENQTVIGKNTTPIIPQIKSKKQYLARLEHILNNRKTAGINQ